MCGINGIFAYRDDAPRVDRDELIVTRECMIRRGPDAEGIWIDEDARVGLAHRRLSIIDFSPAGATCASNADCVSKLVPAGESLSDNVELRCNAGTCEMRVLQCGLVDP